MKMNEDEWMDTGCYDFMYNTVNRCVRCTCRCTCIPGRGFNNE